MLKWFSPSWWRYLLDGCKSWSHFWCRARGHPNGVWWHNLYRDEPDMRCKDCDENLG